MNTERSTKTDDRVSASATEVKPRGYPRPQLVRDAWTSLNGQWDFALDHEAAWRRPDEVRFDRRIQVPFAPEAPASGVGFTGFFRACWYRCAFRAPAIVPGGRLLLQFGAVDYRATVWVDGRYVGGHEGGYTPFAIDITDLARPGADQMLVVRAEDDPHDLERPRGKQDWQLEPHSIWYPRTSGIWQTVWLEVVPPTWIARLRWTPNLERWEIGLAVWLDGVPRDDLSLRARLTARGAVIVDDTYAVSAGEVHRRIALSDPGIDDYRNELLWNPGSPTLIRAEIQLVDRRGTTIDRLRSYTALRSIAIQDDRVVLNGRPFHMRLVLDQGYWPETGLTAPDDEALRRDVELVKAMGFNGVRKHQKIEDPRYLYWADRLGLLVWEEMPSAYRFTQRSIQRLIREWLDVIERDASHPSIVAWVPLNESWGVPNLPDNPAERHYVRSLYHLTKTLDPTRPVIGNDGWESVATDIVGVHDYDPDAERLGRRYQAARELPRLFRRERPGGRLLVLDRKGHREQPVVLSEFGGMALVEAGAWGYSCCTDAAQFAQRYAELLRVVRSLGALSGFCYTQFADTYQEANGLLRADRTPKFPLEEIARATAGTDARPWIPEDRARAPEDLLDSPLPDPMPVSKE